jgi:hypothetical protein
MNGGRLARKVRRLRFPSKLIALAFLLLIGTARDFAQEDVRAVRIAFLYNLTKYVDWQPGQKQIVIGYAGGRGSGAAVARVLEGKEVDGRPIHVVLNPAGADVERCDVLYAADPDTARVREVLTRVRAKRVLTVGETEQFPRMGGMVGLVRNGDRIQLEINLDAATAAGFRISSRVLDLAVIVHAGRSGQ